jgi:hypothetical protein
MKCPDQLNETERITLHFGFYFHDRIYGTRDTVMLVEAILSVEHL